MLAEVLTQLQALGARPALVDSVFDRARHVAAVTPDPVLVQAVLSAPPGNLGSLLVQPLRLALTPHLLLLMICSSPLVSEKCSLRYKTVIFKS